MSSPAFLPKLMRHARGISSVVLAAGLYRGRVQEEELHGSDLYSRSRPSLDDFSSLYCDDHVAITPTLGKLQSVVFRGILPVALADAPSRHDTQRIRASTATYNANSPSEDRWISAHEHGWDVVGVFDGHGGWQVAEFAHSSMMRQLGPRLLHQSHQDEKGVNAALVQSFLAIENAYIDSVKASYKLGFGDVGKVGSCVLVVARKEEDLYVANAGDCRAVLGTRLSSSSSSPSSPSSASSSASGSFAATRLSRDHNARMPTEALALRENHPNEKDIVICKNAHACYVKGRLQVTRSLGDLYLKNEAFNSPLTSHKSSGRRIVSPYSPPYLTATPEVHRYKLGPNDKFVILASDGLWDFLSDQEAVEVVARALAEAEKEGSQRPSHHKDLPAQGGSGGSGLTMDQRRELAAEALVEATLARAAQANRTTVAQLKALPAGSERRRKHDDTTVVVLFLD